MLLTIFIEYKLDKFAEFYLNSQQILSVKVLWRQVIVKPFLYNFINIVYAMLWH